MPPIPITLPEFYRGEVEAIAALVAAGALIVHIRKPNCGEVELRGFVEKLQFRSHLTLHYNTSLAREFGFGGVHLRQGESAAGMRNSYSCHTFTEVEQCVGADYVFLSPIFDSVSKQGYRAAFNHNDLKKFVNDSPAKIVALGGITPENIVTIAGYGFESVAVIGSLWVTDGDRIDLEKTVENYKKLSQAWSKKNLNYNL